MRRKSRDCSQGLLNHPKLFESKFPGASPGE